MIYGNVICQNNMPEIQRCIESLMLATDKILVCDGGSTDGTYEWLKSLESLGNVEVYQRKFTNMQEQRNFLLDKTPKNSWILALDSDEEYAKPAYVYSVLNQLNMESFHKDLLKAIYVHTLALIKDRRHHAADMLFSRNNAIFYYEDGVKWGGHKSHTEPMIDNNPVKSTSDLKIFVYHWPYLMPHRWDDRLKRLLKGKGKSANSDTAGDGDYTTWITNKNKHDIQPIPEEFL